MKPPQKVVHIYVQKIDFYFFTYSIILAYADQSLVSQIDGFRQKRVLIDSYISDF